MKRFILLTLIIFVEIALWFLLVFLFSNIEPPATFCYDCWDCSKLHYYYAYFTYCDKILPSTILFFTSILILVWKHKLVFKLIKTTKTKNKKNT